MPPLVPVDIRDADHPGQNSLPLGDQVEFVDLKFPAPECLLMVQVCLAPGRNAGAPCCTTEVCNAHKTSLREVKYRWHPWHGKAVLVRGEACRGGRVVLQCVRDELKGFPTLEIPEWMFDSRVCSRMYSTAFPHVDCASLLALKRLISAATGSSELNVVQAQHPGKSGDADAQNVSVQNPSRRIVFSTR